MNVYQKFLEPGAEIKKVTLERALELTEGDGYWKSGTVKEMLEKGQVVWTPFSEFAKSPEYLLEDRKDA